MKHDEFEDRLRERIGERVPPPFRAGAIWRSIDDALRRDHAPGTGRLTLSYRLAAAILACVFLGGVGAGHVLPDGDGPGRPGPRSTSIVEPDNPGLKVQRTGSDFVRALGDLADARDDTAAGLEVAFAALRGAEAEIQRLDPDAVVPAVPRGPDTNLMRF